MYKFVIANRISFAVSGVDSGTDNPDVIVNSSGITDKGKLAEYYFRVTN